MKILTGIDIVEVKQFKQSTRNGGENFLNKMFTPRELKNSGPEHLAGIFAGKEAIVKAPSPKIGSWQKIIIVNEPSGRPKAKLPSKITKTLSTFDFSI